MKVTRRMALALSMGAATAPVVSAATQSGTTGAGSPIWRRDSEGRRMADLGDGRFLNPVLSGDHPDPTVLKDGEDFYLTHSSFDASPGLQLWHSRDLVNWAPIGPALKSPPGIVFAPDLAKYKGRYYIYIPFIPAPWSRNLPDAPSIHVIHADDIRGPWSDPVDLGIRGYIDPGHVVGEDDRRYLFLSGVSRVPLTDDGLATAGDVIPVYSGWKYPDSWITESYALEGPKLFRRGAWFYLVSAVGGTSGPPTSHMVIAARSRSIHGPWENCPANPVVRTHASAERWWSRGHATVVEGPGGHHWMLYHGYENGYRSLGRQVLLEPVRWDSQGWFHATGGDLAGPLPLPARAAGAGFLPPPWSDDFAMPSLGTRWNFFGAAPDEGQRARFEDSSLLLSGKGTAPSDANPLVGRAGDHAYECSVEVELVDDAQGGLLLFFNDRLFLGMGIDGQQMISWRGGSRSYWQEPAPKTRRLHLRIVNDRQIVTMYYSVDGRSWTRHGVRSEVSGYNANTVDDLQALRPALYAAGKGAVRFRAYRYRGL